MTFQHALMVQDFLENSADRTPQKEALICGSDRLTYTQVDEMANRFANYLRANGIGRGDRVVLYLPNTVELVAGIFGTLKAGAVFVAVNH
ncbi:MAG: long-chain fatty acid--CoA ligase, partial [Anaerolineae bacterium]|nr:long-chain fatty acid--CoA ligase [Anaerolineae bacterium]